MDRRYNQRIAADLPVVLTVLDSGDERRGKLLDLSESGVSALLRKGVEAGAMVKLEVLGLIFYGHVAYTNPEGTGFRTGIFIEPALLDSSNIVELVNSFLIDHVG
jgi:PilZ domain